MYQDILTFAKRTRLNLEPPLSHPLKKTSTRPCCKCSLNGWTFSDHKEAFSPDTFLMVIVHECCVIAAHKH